MLRRVAIVDEAEPGPEPRNWAAAATADGRSLLTVLDEVSDKSTGSTMTWPAVTLAPSPV
jgi:hypothetical protein